MKIVEAKDVAAWSGDWTGFADFVDGCMILAEKREYQLSDFRCPNFSELSQISLAAFDIYCAQRFKIHTDKVVLYCLEDVDSFGFASLFYQGSAIEPSYSVMQPGWQKVVDERLLLYERNEIAVERVDSDVPVFVCEQPGHFNYGHWLIEIFPKIINVSKFIRSGAMKLALTSQSIVYPHIIQTLNAIGLDESHVLRIEPEVFHLEKAVYMSPVSRHHPHPGSVFPYAVETLNSLRPASQKNRRIFVSRQDATSRQLVDEDLFFSELIPHGFEKVRCGDLSFEEQMSLFKESTYVIGVFGASMSNIVFCPEGARIMIICPNSFLDHFYWNLASSRSASFWYISGKNLENDERSLILYDFEVDLDIFRRFLIQYMCYAPVFERTVFHAGDSDGP